MNCPICSCSSRVEVNMNADGFAQSMFECGHCGALWAVAGNVDILLHKGAEDMKFCVDRH
ncbi:hypothetical protein Gura_4347 [Geotalea uraniireducens Rf4]|uniref:Transcription factor zinc-finger domain-containing protein n=1 Tax=Geotalea uraniireducens (strain Rf4) TaxID=351605 RepID=A5G9M2_GEOUR|nr:hypothetical protein Gura_4347 [Geotalea uraniireducens Rf4]